MTARVQRRQFLSLFGGAALASAPAHAQQPALPVIGYLDAVTLSPDSVQLVAFRKGLNEAGFTEGRNVAIEFRVAQRFEELPALADDLVRRRVNVIFAASTSNAAQAAKAATRTIPIVFQSGLDPVKLGIVPSLGRPGGNITGVTTFTNELNPKRLELLRELVPQAGVIGFLTNPAGVTNAGEVADMSAAARSVGQKIAILEATDQAEIDAAFAAAARQRVDAMVVFPTVAFRTRARQIAELAARYRIPASYPTREFAVAGGLMSYGDDRQDSLRQAGIYVGRVLKGEKPADLPVLQPTKFEFVINLKTAKALGIAFPPSFHLRADEVIE